MAGGDFSCPQSLMEGKCVVMADSGAITCTALARCRTVVVLVHGGLECSGQTWKCSGRLRVWVRQGGSECFTHA